MEISQLLSDLYNQKLTPQMAMDQLRYAPFDDIDIAKLDTHRVFRTGIPEVVYGEGKTVSQLIQIIDRFLDRNCPFLATRISESTWAAIRESHPALVYHPSGRILSDRPADLPVETGPGVAVVSAGTSDFSVVEEARITLNYLGVSVDRIMDVGVAGLHRLLAQLDKIQVAPVVIVVAGMEGALASVVAGLVRAPVIAVPTSVGYGAAFGGLAALLGMLSGCATGVGVVNIDNGFGAAILAHQILQVGKRN